MIAVDYSSSTSFNEDAFEQGIIDHLQTSLGYEHLYGPDVARSSDAFDDAFLPDVIGPALESINPTLNRRAIDASITRLKEIEGSDLIAKNSIFMDMLQNGVEASWFDGKEEHTDIVRLVDYGIPKRTASTLLTSGPTSNAAPTNVQMSSYSLTVFRSFSLN